MKVLQRSKDGGPESTVDAFWLVEIKGLFSIALLRFGDGSRDSYHDHAFHAVSWLIKGCLLEQNMDGSGNVYLPSFYPIVTLRDTFHRVFSFRTSWVLTFRGPWSKTWKEYDPKTNEYKTLAHGRKIV